MKRVLQILLLLFIFNTANVSSLQASHLLGGEITWKCITDGGTQKYKFTVVVYRDCTGCVGCLGTPMVEPLEPLPILPILFPC